MPVFWTGNQQLIKNLVMDNICIIEWLKIENINFFYRGSSLKKDRLTILKVIFQLFSDKSENIRNNVRRYSLLRKQFQPVGWPSAGCVFKNPPGDYAAKIIDQMGFKGLRTFAQFLKTFQFYYQSWISEST